MFYYSKKVGINVYNLKLSRIVFVEKSNRNPHYTFEIARNIRVGINIDSIVIIILGVFLGGVVFYQNQFFIMLTYRQVRKPARGRDTSHFLAVLYMMELFPRVGHLKIHAYIKIRVARTDFILLEHFERLFIGKGICIADNDKLLIVFI